MTDATALTAAAMLAALRAVAPRTVGDRASLSCHSINGLLEEAGDAAIDPLLSGYSPEKAQALRGLRLDADALGKKGLRYEKLDQLMMEHLLGVRG